MSATPEKIGRYTILGRVGRGGMGVLYRAHDPSLDREVALKMMHVDFNVDASARERFQREARAVARLQHPNIVTIHELGEFDGAPFIVMELLGGRDLDQVLRSGTQWTLGQKLDVVAQLCDGLAYAHDQGIVHRDVKPGNIRILDDGKIKILDFGIARFASSSLTQSGTVMGTPSYMAPEQIMGQPVDGRADIFSAGVLLYELLSGQKPFAGDSPTAVAYCIMNSEAPPLRSSIPDLPDAVNEIVSRALRKNPEDRYPQARQMASDLQTVRVMLDLPMTAAGISSSSAATTMMSTSDLYATTHVAVPKTQPPSLDNAAMRPDTAPPTTPPQRPAMNPMFAVAGVGIVVAAIGAFYMLTRGASPAEGSAVTTTAATAPAPNGAGTGVAVPAAFKVTSVPSGASISIDGADTGKVTPADVPLNGRMPGKIALALTGYETLEADLAEADVRAGSKEFTLTTAAGPVKISVSAAYPFELVRGSTVISEMSTRHDVTVEPGGTIAARNPTLLLNTRLSINFRRGSQSISLEAPGTLKVFAANETCKVFADGRDLSFPPIPGMPVAPGDHTVVLRCPNAPDATQRVRVASGQEAVVTFKEPIVQ
jgi:serine/threonine-protein kinase